MSRLFSLVASRYDLITRVFSYGMDRRWKDTAVQFASVPPNGRVLDLACGTGDFSRLIQARLPGACITACDLTEPMVRLARSRGVCQFVCGNATRLPFKDKSFDAVFVGYGFRNFPDVRGAIEEIRRVMCLGGMLVSLDFFLPQDRVFRQLFIAYLAVQGAFWGMVLHGKPRVYTYIADSVRCFVGYQELSGILRQSGFQEVRARPYLSGGIALHWAIRADPKCPGLAQCSSQGSDDPEADSIRCSNMS